MAVLPGRSAARPIEDRRASPSKVLRRWWYRASALVRLTGETIPWGGAVSDGPAVDAGREVYNGRARCLRQGINVSGRPRFQEGCQGR